MSIICPRCCEIVQITDDDDRGPPPQDTGVTVKCRTEDLLIMNHISYPVHYSSPDSG